MDLVLFNAKIIAACLLIFLSFGLVGARVAKWIGIDHHASSLHPFYGWAIAIIFILCLAPWLSAGGIIAFFIVLCFAGLLMLTQRRLVAQTLPRNFFAGALLLLPILYGLCNYAVREWDDMSHWLPNAHFLFQYGRFPASDGPVAYSAWPAYPYAYTSLIAAVGWMMGTFIENVAPLLNIILLILFACFVVEKIQPQHEIPKKWQALQLFGAVFIALTLLNPALDKMLLFSAYAEYVTAILFGLLFYAAWQITQSPARSAILSFALLALVFVQIKQSNIFLLALLAGSMWITAPTQKKKILPCIILGVLPALVAHGFWEFYKSQHLSGLAFTFKPFAEWQWFYLPALFNAMGHVALEKSGYFALLLGLVGYAGYSFFNKTKTNNHMVRAFALVACGHFTFLTLAYIGSRFSEWEITSAASFFRYMTHLQFAAALIVILKISDYIRSLEFISAKLLRNTAFILILVIPALGIAMLAFNGFEKPRDVIQQTRDYAKTVFTKLPPQGKIALIGTKTDGLENTMIRFQWCLMASPQQQPELTGYVTQYSGQDTAEKVRHFAEGYDAVMVAPRDALAANALNQPIVDTWSSYVRSGSNWTRIAE